MTELTPKVIALQEECKELNIKFHHMHGAEKLQELIDAHKADNVKEIPEKEITPIPEHVFKRERRAYNKKEANRLIRCRIQCLDPQKKDYAGEMFSVGSAKLGTFKKYVPFNTGRPWHLPKILFDMLSEKQCSFWYTYTNELGHKLRRSKPGNAFALEVLPPLSREEINKMSLEQARAQGLDR